MNWLSNELLFYGGIICVAIALTGEVLSLCVFKINKMRLEMQMDKEYGTYKKDERQQTLRLGKK